MNLYEVDEKLYYLIEGGFDPTTGEILDQAELVKTINETEMELQTKISNIMRYIKNLDADVEALKTEKQKLDTRRKVKENKIKSLTNYLDSYFKYAQEDYFNDETGKKKFVKFEDQYGVINYRKSKKVQIKDLSKVPQEYIKEHKITESDVDKTALAKYLKAHTENNDFAELVENKNISVK